MDMIIHRQLEPLLNWTNSSYVPEEYEVPSTIEQTHNQPRYGKTNDFGALIDQNSEETAQDYILGIVIGAMIILIVALLWFFVIIVLKLQGQKKVGFFAGRLVRPIDANLTAEKQQAIADGNDNDANEDEQPLNEEVVNEAVPVSSSSPQYRDANRNEKFKQRVWAVRLMFVLSGCFVIIAGGLFYGKGVVSFKNSIDEVRSGISLVQNAALKGIDLTENLLLDKEEIVEEVDTTEEVKDESESGEICGLDSETSNQIRLAYDEFTTNVEELTDMLDGTLEGFSDDLRSLISLTQNIDDSLDTADIFFYILIAISVVIICIVAAMLVAVFFAIKVWENTFTRIIKGALLWPFFIFFLLLSWIFATLFLVFSLAGADFWKVRGIVSSCEFKCSI